MQSLSARRPQARRYGLRRSEKVLPRSPRVFAALVPASDSPIVWKTWVSRHKDLSSAVDEIFQAAGTTFPTARPELALVFVSSAHNRQYPELVQLLRGKCSSLKTVIGSTGFGIIGNTEDGPVEVEHAHALSVTLATLPQSEVKVAHVADGQLPDGDAGPQLWAKLLDAPLTSSEPLNFVVVAEPTFQQLPALLEGMDFAFPSANKIGGLSSAGMMSGQRALFCWSADHEEGSSGSGMVDGGAVVMSIHGGVVMESMIAQGCRPLSRSVWSVESVKQDMHGRRVVMTVKDGTGSSRTAMEALAADVMQACKTAAERNHALQNLTVGIECGAGPLERRAPADPHDFLIRGLGPVGGTSMWIGDDVRPGQRLRFMVRDRQGAMEDLKSHALGFQKRQLEALMTGRPSQPAIGVLMFSCNGRGTELYQQPNYDARTVSDFIPAPISGFLCSGELGRVGESTYLHGFTAAVAVLRAAQTSPRSVGSTAPASATPADASAADHGSSQPTNDRPPSPS